MRRLPVWLLPVGSVVLVSWLWHAPRRMPEEKPAPGQVDLAAAAGVDLLRLVVDFRDDVPAAVLAGNGFDEIPVSDQSAEDRVYYLDFSTPEAAEAARRTLAADPQVESVDYDETASVPDDDAFVLADPSMEAECGAPGGRGDGEEAPEGETAHRGFPDDRCFKYQWHLGQLDLPASWKLGHGDDVVVAVIDTGVSRVPDLAKARFVPGYNFVGNNANAADDHGHGTHVAGTIAQSTNNGVGVAGVAWGASIMPVKVLSAGGSGSMAGIVQGIRFAADKGAKVINMSLGGPFPMAALANAVDYARKKGVTVIAAAGNDGRGKVGYPAKYPGVVAVAATQFDESTTFYSNWGAEIDVAAPGGNTQVDQNGDGKPDGVLQNTIVPRNIGKTDYLWFMGTSMASPHAAGVAALIVGAGVTKPQAVEQILLGTARAPKGRGKLAAEHDDHYGAGIVDAGAALRKARQGKGAAELGLGAAFAAAAALGLRRRRLLAVRPGLGFLVALVLGSSGLFFLPSLGIGGDGPLGLLSLGLTDLPAALLGPAAQGIPLLWSALPALLAVGILFGVRRARPAVAGLAFGLAGALAFAALAGTIDVRFIPDALDRVWLAANAALAALLGVATLRE